MNSGVTPWFILAGGINGAGKSTFLQAQHLSALREMLALAGDSVIEVINPDTETRRLLAQDSALTVDVANIRAADFCESRVRTLIAERQGHFAIETVLSSGKYFDIVGKALGAGWNVLFIYVVLDSVDDAIGRVANRVRSGGHDVPKEKIIQRWPRSLANVAWFWERATTALVFYNPPNYGAPELIAAKLGTESEPLHLQLERHTYSRGVRELLAACSND